MDLLRAYRCTDQEGFGAATRSGLRVERERGFQLGTTLRSALDARASSESFGAAWPLRAFELLVDPKDVLSTEGDRVRARAFHVEREVPREEIFGSAIDEVAARIDEVRRSRWLTVDAARATEARIAEVVHAHDAALAVYGPVRPVALQVVRTWDEARRAYNPALAMQPPLDVAVQRACSVPHGSTLAAGIPIVQSAVTRIAFERAWDAAWTVAGRSSVAVLGELQKLPGDPHQRLLAALRSFEATSRAYGAARAISRRAAWEEAHRLFTYAPGDLTDPFVLYQDAVRAGQQAFQDALPKTTLHGDACAFCRSIPSTLAAIAERTILVTSDLSWHVAVHAAQHVGMWVAYKLNQVDQPDPFWPLVELWQLGCWPIGRTAERFVVFLPETTN